ncbi:CD209 antigen-like protein D [Phodopus roborovskii]|uniref:CD209 antigen-like protein D n=1 Tax=Phodopus roborovskii TaxID=109678 RepID=UPI0021E3E57B|nr:CD209 antigen-like protein D [Phodopus roborovskii]
MGDTTKPRLQQLVTPEDKESLISGTRYSVISSGLRPDFGIKSLTEYLKHSCKPLVLQLLSFLFLAGLHSWPRAPSICFPVEWALNPSRKQVVSPIAFMLTLHPQTFLQQTSKAKGPTWMGLSDLYNEATWHWVDGSPLSPSFVQNWNKGEPKNVEEENCTEFSRDGWNDLKCDTLNFWICKKASTSLCTTK